MLHELHGDLIRYALAGEFDAIVHGCNCFCTMGAGIAKQIRHNFPEAWEADLNTAKGDPAKLGTCSSAVSQGVLVINAYTQFDHQGTGVKADYRAIRGCMEKIAADHSTLRIGMPQIGAGLAGGDWKIIHDILASVFTDVDATVVHYRPEIGITP